MFTIKSYKLFESNLLPEDVDFCNNILSKKDEIEKDFDIEIVHRRPFGQSGSKFIDLNKIFKNGDGTDYTNWPSSRSHFGTYDISTKQFVLFYDGNKYLTHSNYIRIDSENFFDGLETVYYKAFLDI
jgi:hypothetical protein